MLRDVHAFVAKRNRPLPSCSAETLWNATVSSFPVRKGGMIGERELFGRTGAFADSLDSQARTADEKSSEATARCVKADSACGRLGIR